MTVTAEMGYVSTGHQVEVKIDDRLDQVGAKMKGVLKQNRVVTKGFGGNSTKFEDGFHIVDVRTAVTGRTYRCLVPIARTEDIHCRILVSDRMV